MPSYYVDDGGDNSDGSSWEKAYTSLASLVSAVAAALTTSGNTVYIGDDHIDSVTGANRTITGPSSGLPVILISADRTSNATPPAYKKGTGKQIRSDDGAFTLVLDGSFATYGLRIVPGATTSFYPLQCDQNESGYSEDCTYVIPANGVVVLGLSLGRTVYKNLTIDLTADGTTNRSGVLINPDSQSFCFIQGLTFINAGYRTGTIFKNTAALIDVSGADFSGFNNATLCELADLSSTGLFIVSNCKTAPTWAITPAGSALGATARAIVSNTGPADAPTHLAEVDYFGTTTSSAAIYRTGGATVEGDATSWLVTSAAACSEASPFYSPWMYGLIASAGAHTVDVFVTNDSADLTDAEIWLEVEYMATLDIGLASLASDHRATITTTAAAQTADATSSWNGSGPAFSHKQKLSVGITVGETGQFRARVVVGKASIAAANNLYIDPKPVVS